MKTATLTNTVNGKSVEVYATTEHSASSYGIPVWVDSEGQAYCQVGSEAPFYDVSNQRDINTLDDLADYYNGSDDCYVYFLEKVIEQCGWVSDCAELPSRIAHSKTEKCVIDDKGKAIVVAIEPAERIANAIRDAREAQGMSLRALSEKTGINISNLSGIESGKTSPTVDTLAKIACALRLQLRLE